MYPRNQYNSPEELYNRFREQSGERRLWDNGLGILETALIRLSDLNRLGFCASQETIEKKLKEADYVILKNHKYQAKITNISPDLIKYYGNEHLSRTLVQVSDIKKSGQIIIR